MPALSSLATIDPSAEASALEVVSSITPDVGENKSEHYKDFVNDVAEELERIKDSLDNSPLNKDRFYDPYLPSIIKDALKVTDNAPSAKEFARHAKKFIFDSGVARNVRVQVQTPDGEVIIDEASPSPLFNRSGLKNLAKETFEGSDDAKGKFHLQMFDIKDFRAADNVKTDAEITTSADVLINKVGMEAYATMAGINNALAKNGIEGYVVAARYGGDELAFAFFNIIDPKLRHTISDTISQRITTIEGYYMENGVPVKRNVGLKEGFEEIGIPDDHDEADTFWETFTAKGLIMNGQEIKLAMKHRYEMELETEPIRDSIRSWKRVEDLGQRHPRLIPMIQAAKAVSISAEQLPSGFIDYLPSSANQKEEFLGRVEDFIRREVYHPLLGEFASGISEFASDIVTEQTNRVIVVDLKFIKEINDNSSLATGDNAIYAVGSELIKILEVSGDRFDKLRIYARGSMFLIRELEDGVLSQDQLDAFSALDHISLNIPQKDGTEKEAEIPIATNVSASHLKRPRSSAEVREFIDEQFDPTERAFYISQLKKYGSDLELIQKGAPKGYSPDLADGKDTFRAFLHGKRELERMKNVLRYSSDHANYLVTNSPQSPDLALFISIRNAALERLKEVF